MESVKFAAPVDTADEWKKKKNYKPAALFTVLLLGTAFLAGKSYAAYGSNASVPTGSLSATGGYCIPADGTFGGTSKTDLNGDGHPSEFETCYYQTTSVSTYCWTKSWLYEGHIYKPRPENGKHFMCVPGLNDGTGLNDGGVGSVWRPIDWSTPLSIRTSCGPPCQLVHQRVPQSLHPKH